MTDYRIRVSRPIISHLEGSGAWQDPDTDGSGPEARRLMAKLKAASARDDGSVMVMLDDAEREVLREYVDVQAIGAKDNIYPPHWPEAAERSALGEYNACMALIRRIDKLAAMEAKLDRVCGCEGKLDQVCS